ncbi:MAG: DUF1097 domain-containing protein [Clostridia bacterium]|nr:DUF1097 domain-containing protein [Clostridia bacterium]
MKKFWSIFKMPIIVGIIASVIYIIDAFLGKALADGSFMWVAFVSWTIFYGVSFNERIRALIGNVIGFLFGLLMFHSSSFFGGSVAGISIAGLLFVFLANGGMMFFPKLKKVWMNSISGIFMGVFLTFSGLGVSLYPTSVSNAFLQLGTILIYSTFGLVAGYLCTYFGKEKTASIPEVEKDMTTETIQEENKEEIKEEPKQEEISEKVEEKSENKEEKVVKPRKTTTSTKSKTSTSSTTKKSKTTSKNKKESE